MRWAENKALREALKREADARVKLARLGLEIRLLHHLEAAMREKSDDRTFRTDAARLVRRNAPHTRGNRLVWQVPHSGEWTR